MIQIIPFLQETALNMQKQTFNPSEKESAQFMNDFALLLAVLLGDNIPKEQMIIPTENAISRHVTHLSDIMITAEEEPMVPEGESIPDTDKQSSSLGELKGEESLEERKEVEEAIVPLEDDPPTVTGEEVVVIAQVIPQPIMVDRKEIKDESESLIQMNSTHPPDDSIQIMNVLEKVEPLSQMEKTIHVRDKTAMGEVPLIPDDGLTKLQGNHVSGHPRSAEPFTQALLQNRGHQTVLLKVPDQKVGQEHSLVEMTQKLEEPPFILEGVEEQTLSLSSLEINEPQEEVPLMIGPNEEFAVRSSEPFAYMSTLGIQDETAAKIESEVDTTAETNHLLEKFNGNELETAEETRISTKPETSTSGNQSLVLEGEHGETTHVINFEILQESPKEDGQREIKPKQAEGKQWKPSQISVSLNAPPTITHEPSVDSLQESTKTWTLQETLLDLEETQKIVPKLTERLQTLISEERSEVRIQLKPESLGELKIKLSLEQGVVSAEFVVESETVREVIAANLPQLRSTLQDMGTTVSQLAVNISTGKKDSQDDPARRLWERRAFNTKRGPRGIGSRLEAGTVFAKSDRSWNQVDLKA